MKNLTKKKIAVLIMTAGIYSANAQWSPNWPGNVPNWDPSPTGAGNSEPALMNPTPWALGGNSLFGITWNGQITNDPAQIQFKTASIGTVDDAPFIMKANNRESIFISQSSHVGIGWNVGGASNPGGISVPLEIWSEANAIGDRSNLRFYADAACNIESDQEMTLLFRSGKSFHVKEGSVAGTSIHRITALGGGNCGINNSAPQAALDIRSNTSPSSFRIFGDAAGNVHSTVDMKLHYGTSGGEEFHINSGSPGSATTRMLLNVWGAHIHTGGTFNGLFIGPSTSPWYNNSNGTRIWLDAITSGGLAIVGGGGNDAMFVANAAGAKRFQMLINAGGGDDTKFDMRGSVQMGFFQSPGAWEDVNTRLNVAALAGGVKVTTNNNNTKAYFVENSNFTPNNTFVVFGDGRTRIGTGSPHATGVAANAMLSVDGMILAKDIRVSVAQGTHWADYVFEKDYCRMPLSEVKDFVGKNKHLPGVPSEAEIKDKGLDVVDMNIRLLEKIEELYLHSIDMKEDLDNMRKENAVLKQAVSELQAR